MIKETTNKFSSKSIENEKNLAKLPTSSEDMIENMSDKIKTEAENFEPETKIEKTLDEIKADHMKNIYSLDMKISSIKSNNTYSYSESLTKNSNSWTSLKILKETLTMLFEIGRA